MSAYQYQAINKAGHHFKGIIEADSLQHARLLLKERKLAPLHLVLVDKTTQTKRYSKISPQNLALFTRQLATLLAAGIPVEEALQGVSEQTEKNKVQQLILGVRAKVMEGYSLAQALGEYPQAFPELYRATVGAGEQTGRLDLILIKLADYTENQQQIKQKIQQALIYPSLMIIVTVSIISFLLTFVVPKIIDVFSSSGQTLPGMTIVLIALSHFIKNYGTFTLLLLMLALFGFKQSLRYLKIKKLWHRWLLKIPMVAYLIRSTNLARYIHTFSILFLAGVNVLKTMQVCTNLINNLIMQEAFFKANIKVKEGIAIHRALKDTQFMPPMVIHLVASGEKSGQLSEMMERAAQHLDNEVKRLIDTSLTLLEPLIILIMGAGVLFIVLATLLPIFSMEQLVG